MKLTLLLSNAANFRGDATMNFARYWNHHLSLQPPNNLQNLEELVELVNSTGADIVGINEIDKCAHWSARVDQPEYLKQRLGYYGVYGRNYDSPAPWLYTANTGNTVLSRFPVDTLLSQTVKFKRQNWFERITASIGTKHFIHTVHTLPNRRVLHVVCTHLSTNFRDLRENGAVEIVEYFAKNILPLYRKCDDSYILMGDFNTVPIYTSRKHGFNDGDDDEKDFDMHTILNWELGAQLLEKFVRRMTKLIKEKRPDDYRDDQTLRLLSKNGYFKSTMKINPFDPNETDDGRYSYPNKWPNRLIDYIFVSPDIVTTDVETLPVKYSDHKAIKTTVYTPD